MINREFVQELIAAADLLQIIGEQVPLKKSGSGYFGLCPFHTEKTPSFSVNPSKGFYHCFGCGASGSALNFIIQTECGGDFVRGVETLAARLGIAMPRGDDDGRGRYFRALAAANDYFRQHLKKSDIARNYLKTRGIEENTAAAFNLGYAPKSDDIATAIAAAEGGDKTLLKQVGLLRKNEEDGDFYNYFHHRLMFPIMGSREWVNGFGGRTLAADNKVKYLNSPDSPVFSKKNTIFGAPQARDAAREKNRVVVVEGYMDVVMLSQVGFAESVAVMGTAFTPQQMRKISRLATNIVLAFDGDRAGQDAAWRCLPGILPTMSDGMSVSFLFLPEKEDPDSFVRAHGKDGMEAAIGNSKPLGEYMAERLWAQQKADSEEGRTSAALTEGQNLVALLKADKAPYLREMLMAQLTRHAGIAPTVMKTAISRPPRTSDNKSRFRMRTEGLLFNFLSCLAAHPDLWDSMQTPPLLPGNAAESEIAARVLHYLRVRKEEDGEPDIIGFLNNEGFVLLARQMQERCRQGFGENPSAEFSRFVERIKVGNGNRKRLPYPSDMGGKKFIRPPKREPGESE